MHFAYRAITVFGRPFQSLSAIQQFCNFPTPLQWNHEASHDPEYTTLAGLAYIRFRLFRVRSPLLAESRLISTPVGT